MKQVTILQLTKYRRLYNDVVRKKLTQANIKFEETDTRKGGIIKILVNDNDFENANKIVLSVSHTNPKY